MIKVTPCAAVTLATLINFTGFYKLAFIAQSSMECQHFDRHPVYDKSSSFLKARLSQELLLFPEPRATSQSIKQISHNVSYGSRRIKGDQRACFSVEENHINDTVLGLEETLL